MKEDNGGAVNLLLKIPPGSIKGIIFGMNMKNDHKNGIENSRLFEGRNDYYVKQSEIDDSKFEFTYQLKSGRE